MTSESHAQQTADLAAGVEGVASVTVTDRDGLPLASAGSTDAARDAVLASFVATRVLAMTAEGDLRGKGRVLHESRLLHASFSGRNRDFALVPSQGRMAFVTVRGDAIPDIVVDDILQALHQVGQQ